MTIKNFLIIMTLKKNNKNLSIEDDVQIKNHQKLFLGENIVIQKGTILHCGGEKWCDYHGKISIGDNAVISPYCVFYGAGNICIGKNFDCAPGVKIFSSNSDMLNKKKHLFKPVNIGDNVIIYANTVINLGVNIGNDSVIGANSLVTCDIPAGEFWAGNPAKFIKKI